MSGIKLDIHPYNDIWLGCVHNNIIAMLIARDESFRDIILFLEATYRKKIIDQNYSSEEAKTKMLTEGFYVPCIDYKLEVVMESIMANSNTSHSLDFDQLKAHTKSFLHDGFCMLLKVDRYYYPSGREAGKTHMIHPVFIHGYDDERSCFHTIEDCMTPGLLENYELPYTAVQDSFRYFEENGINFEVTICKVDEKALNYQGREILPSVKNTLSGLLKSERIYKDQYDLYYQTGISSLEQYAAELDYLLQNMMDASQFRTRTLMYQQFHMRNQQLIRYLDRNRLIESHDAERLCGVYNQVQRSWNAFKIRGYYLLEERQAGKQVDYGILVDKMNEISKLEKEAAQSFLEII